jgi:mono/diheme cytochrome c family protein
MKLPRTILSAAGILFFIGGILSAAAQPSNPAAATKAVYVPDLSHASGTLADGVLAWDNVLHQMDAAADQNEAHFTFYFTNISAGNITILDVHPSCGCTTAQLPDLPWTIPAGTNGQIGVTVNLEGKSGMLFKSVDISTDKGTKRLYVRVNILPPVIHTLTDAERAQQMLAAKADRQAVFKNDCATCHVKPGEGKYGPELYAAVCGICHEGPNRATMVPDLHAIKTPTNDSFWQAWIAHGKPGSLMPAFSTADGGPLTDIQIASLAAYLDSAIPAQVTPPMPTPVPPPVRLSAPLPLLAPGAN